MKCPRCHRTMARTLYKENKYYYKCPNCKNEIGKPEEKETAETATQESEVA